MAVDAVGRLTNCFYLLNRLLVADEATGAGLSNTVIADCARCWSGDQQRRVHQQRRLLPPMRCGQPVKMRLNNCGGCRSWSPDQLLLSRPSLPIQTPVMNRFSQMFRFNVFTRSKICNGSAHL